MGQRCCVPLGPLYGELGGDKDKQASAGDCKNKLKQAPSSLSKKEEDAVPMIDDYVTVKKIGCGAMSIVKMVYNRNTQKRYAVKVLNKSFLKKRKPGSTEETPFEKVMREISILRSLSHPNVVQLVEVVNKESSPKLFIVFELLDCTLESVINSLTLNQTKRLFVDVVAGLLFVHSKNIIHRDIKPENILLNDDLTRAKVCDFGCAQIGPSIQSTAGTPAFWAPELFQATDKPIDGVLTDIWALGITLYYISFQKLPFEGSSVIDLKKEVLSNRLVFDCSSDQKALISRMLHKAPSQRIGLIEIMQHKWLEDMGK